MTMRHYDERIAGFLLEIATLVHPSEASVSDLAEMMALARSMHRLDEERCCRELRAWEEALDERMSQRIARLAERLGFTAELQGDPRGAPVWLHHPRDAGGRGSPVPFQPPTFYGDGEEPTEEWSNETEWMQEYERVEEEAEDESCG